MPISDFGRQGARGVWTPPFLADIIPEQPLIGFPAPLFACLLYVHVHVHVIYYCTPL